MKRLSLTAIALIAVVGAANAQVSSVWLRVVGQKQGQFKGDSTQKGHENQMSVDSFDHTIISPRDAATGLPTGKRQHRPFMITKTVASGAWVQFHQALTTNENLPVVFLDIFSTRNDGLAVLDRTIKLTSASVASMEDFWVPTSADRSIPGHHEMTVTLTYQKIEWDWHPSGQMAEDSWAQNLSRRIGAKIGRLAMR